MGAVVADGLDTDDPSSATQREAMIMRPARSQRGGVQNMIERTAPIFFLCVVSIAVRRRSQLAQRQLIPCPCNVQGVGDAGSRGGICAVKVLEKTKAAVMGRRECLGEGATVSCDEISCLSCLSSSGG